MLAFPRPDKTRPALVLTRSSVIPYLSTVTVAPVTRTIRGIPTEVRLGIAEGLKSESVANLDSLQTVGKERLGRYIGSISVRRKTELRKALLFALELNSITTASSAE
jgi:mRNA interferase MazF